MKGWIALDIDGTITAEKNSVPRAVVAYLDSLQGAGWRIALVTGRPLAYTEKALADFGFPYVLIVQNGSAIFSMPGTKFTTRTYLNPNVIAELDQVYEGIESDYLIYSGFERGDFCFFRPERFAPEEAHYLMELQTRQLALWRGVKEFDPKEIDFFPLVKCFGSKERMEQIADRLAKKNLFEIAHIRDPQFEGMQVLLVTAQGVTKGAALKEVIEREGRGGRVIAAGDDANDFTLLAVADRRIVMPHAPLELQKVADRIAPPVEKMGIIQALQEEVGDGS